MQKVRSDVDNGPVWPRKSLTLTGGQMSKPPLAFILSVTALTNQSCLGFSAMENRQTSLLRKFGIGVLKFLLYSVFFQ